MWLQIQGCNSKAELKGHALQATNHLLSNKMLRAHLLRIGTLVVDSIAAKVTFQEEIQ